MAPQDRTVTDQPGDTPDRQTDACAYADGLYLATRTDQLLVHLLLALEGAEVGPCAGGDPEHQRAHRSYQAGTATRQGGTSRWGRWTRGLDTGELEALGAVLVAWGDRGSELAGHYPGTEHKVHSARCEEWVTRRVDALRGTGVDQVEVPELAETLEAARRRDRHSCVEVAPDARACSAEELVGLYRSTFAAAQGSGAVAQTKLLWLLARHLEPVGDQEWERATGLLERLVPPPRHLGIDPDVVRGERDRWWGTYRDAVERRPNELLAAHGATGQLAGATAFVHAERSAYYRALGRPGPHGQSQQRPVVRPTGLEQVLDDAYQGARGWWAVQVQALGDGRSTTETVSDSTGAGSADPGSGKGDSGKEEQ